jgi:hypothetical protein
VDAALGQIAPRPILQSAGEFYDNQRWGSADVIAAGLVGLPIVVAAML